MRAAHRRRRGRAGAARPRRAEVPVAVTLGPYVQDVRSDGFTVVFETDADVAAEVRAGDVRVATHGTHHEAIVRGLPKTARAAIASAVEGHDAGGGEVVLPDAARPLTFVVYGDTRRPA